MTFCTAAPGLAASQKSAAPLNKEDFYFRNVDGSIRHGEVEGVQNCINFVDLCERHGENYYFKEYCTKPGSVTGAHDTYNNMSLNFRAPVKFGSSESQVLAAYGKTKIRHYNQYDYLVYSYYKPADEMYYQVFVFDTDKTLATLYWSNAHESTPSDPVNDIEAID